MCVEKTIKEVEDLIEETISLEIKYVQDPPTIQKVRKCRTDLGRAKRSLVAANKFLSSLTSA